MKLSKIEEQALRLSLSLARAGGEAGLTELAEREGLSTALAAKVLGMLKRGGVVRAVRGRNGGYALTVGPEEISLASVVLSTSPVVLQTCANLGVTECQESCPHVGGCGLRAMLEVFGDRLASALERLSLADLLDEEPKVRAVVDRAWVAESGGA